MNNESRYENEVNNIVSDEEENKSLAFLEKMEENGLKNIVKYFDRIHDKLFTFNNILIAGYFALSKFNHDISSFYILIPILNLVLLIYIEYRMMEMSRYESEITKKTLKEREKSFSSTSRTNRYSLLSIITTFLVTLFFLKNLLL